MRKQLKRLSKPLLLGLAALSVAATPKQGDLVDILDFVNARSDKQFGSENDNNKMYELKKGTKAVVGETHFFKKTGSYGLCLHIINADLKKSPNTQDCYWVYYVESRKNIKLYDLKGDAQKAWLDEASDAKNKVTAIDLKNTQPAKATVAEVVKDTTAVIERAKPTNQRVQSLPAPPAPVKESGADKTADKASTESLNKSVATSIADTNAKLQKTIDPSATQTPMCPTGKCYTPASKYEQCTAADSYLKNEILLLEKNPTSYIASLSNKIQPEKYVKDICFEVSMKSAGGPFKYCGPGENGKPKKEVPRACYEEKISALTRNSFDAVGECLGDYLTGNKSTVKESMLQIFALMNVESHLQMNARSPVIECTQKLISEGKCSKLGAPVSGGAGGVGQLTYGAIETVNNAELARMKEHLKNNTNPTCQMIKNELSKPMKSNFEESCSRISLSDGSPLKNMIYTMAYQRNARAFLKQQLLNSGVYGDIFSSLSAADRDYLERSLALWAHNAGNEGLRYPLKMFLDRNINRKLRNIDDINKFFADFRQFMPLHPSPKSRRMNKNEPVQFFDKIQTGLQLLNKNAGGGSCLVP